MPENLKAIFFDMDGTLLDVPLDFPSMRKKLGLKPKDVVALALETDELGKKLIQKFEADLKKTILVSKIEFKENDGSEIKIDDLSFKIKIEK